MTEAWRPAASLETLRLRARLLARVRQFFAVRRVLEVDTPALSAAATPAPHLHSFAVDYHGPQAPASGRLFLHTSPEFPMKRLLAAGSGDIYQLCKVFRDAEAGPRHNPEFTLLEWYRVGFELAQLMDEVEALLRAVLAGILELPPAERLSYRALFQRYAGIDGLSDSIAPLRDCLTARGHQPPADLSGDDVDVWRDLVLTHVIEPQLQGLVFVYDYPASQAALARIRSHTPPVAERFECYLDGVELANGFQELTDSEQQRQRFQYENRMRTQNQQPAMPLDERLLAALAAGMPECSGVALGFDRLLLCASGHERLQDALAFPIGQA